MIRRLHHIAILAIVTVLTVVMGFLWAQINWAQLDHPSDNTRAMIKKIQPEMLPDSSSEEEQVSDELLVKYKKNIYRADSIDNQMKGLTEIGDKLHKQYQIDVLSTSPITGVQRIAISPNADRTFLDILAKIKKNPAVEYVEPNYTIYPLGTPQTNPPNDEEWRYGELWGMVTIHMQQAWMKGWTGGNVIVAVIDSGVDYKHHELEPNMWVNPNPTFGDKHGADFCHRDEHRRPTGDPMDDTGHGTMVAGIIAAKGNNEISVTGVNWDGRIIMALKSLCKERNGRGTVWDAVHAIDYAIEHKAQIINASWGTKHFSKVLKSAIEDANTAKILFVAAAGNTLGGKNNDVTAYFPANYDLNNVMAVGATDEKDQLWKDSHWGVKKVHIAAPGVEIVTTGLGSTPGNPGQGKSDGTSLAAPYVSGCAALILSAKPAGTHISPRTLRKKIMEAADKVQALDRKIRGGKRLNCFNALNHK